jgi:hypothetical protein
MTETYVSAMQEVVIGAYMTEVGATPSVVTLLRWESFEHRRREQLEQTRGAISLLLHSLATAAPTRSKIMLPTSFSPAK